MLECLQLVAAQAVERQGISGHEMSLLPPEAILGPIARTIGSGDMPFPSPGTGPP